MKVLFLHGAIKNSGDYLIAHRSQALIKHIVPECDIVSIWEGESPKTIKRIINEVDGIVFGGGPFFTNHIYPQDIPLVESLNEITIPMINIGGGWYGKNNSYTSIKAYSIDESSIELLKKIELSSGELSCRDWYTVYMLREKGFNAQMHGCPAWYNLDFLELSEMKQYKHIKKICISDPADLNYSIAAKELIKWIKAKYPNAEITFVFHRGMWDESEGKRGERRRKALEPTLLSERVNYIDISGGYEGFKVYDDCDLHIGFRVHAHIYNMSRRNFSILLEEDGRGAGVNNALGISGVHVYDEKRQNKGDFLRKSLDRVLPKVNNSLVEELEYLLQRNTDMNGMEYCQAYKKMQYYYQKMYQHILKIKEWG